MSKAKVYEKDGAVWWEKDGWTICALKDGGYQNPLFNNMEIISVKSPEGKEKTYEFFGPLSEEIGAPKMGLVFDYHKVLLEEKED